MRSIAILCTILAALTVGAHGAKSQTDKAPPGGPGALPGLVRDCVSADIPATDRVEICSELLDNPALNKEGHVTALAFRGTAKMDIFDYSGAVADFTRALDIAPSNIGLLQGRAQALDRLDRHDQALVDYDTAIQIAPKYAALYTGRALIHAQMEHIDAAFRDLKTARRIDPNNPETLAMLGGMHTEVGAYDKAIESFSEAIELAPDAGRLYLRRGLARMKAGDWEESLDDLTRSIDLDGDLPDAFMLRAMVHREAERTDRALSDYSTAIDGDPTLVGAWQGRGLLYMEEKRFEEARSDLDVAAQIAPTASNLNSLAWLLVSADDKGFRDPEAALDYVERSLDIDENADNVDTAAAAYVLLGDIDHATQYYIRSMELGGGERVRTYQEYLQERGFYTGALDGIDGPRTREAIRTFAEQGRVLLVD